MASASVFGMRVVALIGILMAGVGVALIAASYRRSVAVALALGIVNPLVLLHLLGGSHNDALMLGFLALGFAAFLRERKLTGGRPRRVRDRREAHRCARARVHGLELA